MDLTIGMKGTASTLVERSDTALEVGSGDLFGLCHPLHGSPYGGRSL